MYKRGLSVILTLFTLLLFVMPVASFGEFVFQETPVASEDENTGRGAEDVESADATAPNGTTATPSPTLEPTLPDDGWGSIVSFNEVEPIDHGEDARSAVPTKTPILNDTWPKEIVVTFGGDCTIGCTVAQAKSPRGFDAVAEREGFAWFFSGILDVFALDDMTLVNFEGALTNETTRAEKSYNFKGPKEYVEILQLGSVEAVNLANNHTRDYGEKGQLDTMQAMDEAGIVYCASNQTGIYETRGVKIGLVGNTFPYRNEQRDISQEVKELRAAGCQIVIASFHWGPEHNYGFTREQRMIGRAAIKSGADIVVGHHPHVIQSIEKYEGTYIIYSLGNLVFGGNPDPKDKDTFLAQATFTVNEDGTLEGEPKLAFIPVLLTDQAKGTDYRPVIVTEEKDYDRIMKKILKQSTNMEGFVNPR